MKKYLSKPIINVYRICFINVLFRRKSFLVSKMGLLIMFLINTFCLTKFINKAFLTNNQNQVFYYISQIGVRQPNRSQTAEQEPSPPKRKSTIWLLRSRARRKKLACQQHSLRKIPQP